ncbi:MAG: phage portal protein [Alphaproteobacteria bacterium]
MTLWQQFKQTFPSHARTKASAVGSMVVTNILGQPQWTPRRYDTLAEEGYHKNVIVNRCVNLIARGLSSIPWLLYRGEHEIAQHPLLTLLNSPSPRQAGSSFMEEIVSYLLLSGNAYIEAVLDEHQHPAELYCLRPDRVKVVPGPGGVPQAFDYTVSGQSKRLGVDPLTGHSCVLHIKLFNPLNDWYGMSPLEAAAASIDQHNAVGNHNLALLQNGGRPSGAFLIRSSPNSPSLTDQQRETLRHDIRDVYEGTRNAGKIIVLEGDFDWKEMGLSPRDLDFIEGKNVSAREIVQAFGVPPMLAGVPGDATFANYREARFHLWEDTILPLLELLMSELNLWLTPFFQENLSISYDCDAIPALAPRREAQWQKIANADFLTINEKRQAVGYTPIAGGDNFFIPQAGDSDAQNSELSPTS